MNKGKYIFFPKNLDRIYSDTGSQYWHCAPYRTLGVQRVEWQAIRVLRLLKRDKTIVNIKWKEEKVWYNENEDIPEFYIIIVITFEVKNERLNLV
jgi:hypothetical protein